MRFGWTFVIGLIPVVGDVADASLNYFLVVRKAKQAEIPEWLWRRMLVNNAVSAAVGFVPVVGDIALATFKANSRNSALLEEFLTIRGQEAMKAQSVRIKGAEGVKPGAGLEAGETVDSLGAPVASGSTPAGSIVAKKGSIWSSLSRKSKGSNDTKHTKHTKHTKKTSDPQALIEAAKTVDKPI